MKKIIFITILHLVSISLFGQQPVDPSTTLQEYLQKSKNQKKAANVLLIGGGALMVTSFLIPRGDLINPGWCTGGVWCGEVYKNDGIKATTFLIGSLSALASIPVFIVAKSNLKKSATVGFKMEKTLQMNNQNLVYSSCPGVRVKVDF